MRYNGHTREEAEDSSMQEQEQEDEQEENVKEEINQAAEKPIQFAPMPMRKRGKFFDAEAAERDASLEPAKSPILAAPQSLKIKLKLPNKKIPRQPIAEKVVEVSVESPEHTFAHESESNDLSAIINANQKTSFVSNIFVRSFLLKTNAQNRKSWKTSCTRPEFARRS